MIENTVGIFKKIRIPITYDRIAICLKVVVPHAVFCILKIISMLTAIELHHRFNSVNIEIGYVRPNRNLALELPII